MTRTTSISPTTWRVLLALLFLTAAVLQWSQNGTVNSYASVRNVTTTEAKSLIDSGALVIDVRGEEQFKARHIPGSVLVPLEMLRLGVPLSIAYAKTKPVVVYCGDGTTKGPEATDLLNKAGFSNAVNIEPGIQGWEKAGYPVVRN